jgi:dTDP-4-amino-4,6-dideoxygalactose transaminase/methionyl-tRNA formyltransferase
MKVVFLGNHTVGVHTLRALNRHAFLAGVVAHPEDPEDGVRYESVFAEAARLGVPAIRSTGKAQALKDFIRACSPDMLWIADFRYLLPADVVALAPLGAVNLHPSLLPAYRGRASINWAILRGETRLGLTAHIVDVGMDTGDIVGQRNYELGPDEDVGDALEKLYPIYDDLTAGVLARFSAGTPERRAQRLEGASAFPRRRPEDGLIVWDAPASQVRNLVRAVAAPYPGAFSPWSGGLLRVWKAGDIVPATNGQTPGTVIASGPDGCLIVACRDAALTLTRHALENTGRVPGVGDVLGDACPASPVPHNRLSHGEEEIAAVAAVVGSGHWADGDECTRAEARFAAAAGTSHAIGVGSGLGALRLALRALGVGAGDAVAVPGYSCVALANAVLACGAEPVPVEIDPSTLNLCPAALRTAVRANPRIRAAVVVHTFGCPADMAALESAGIPLIEDCSHAFGRGGLGGRGRLAIMSLYATKLVGAGEGGMVFTAYIALADRIRSARDYSDQPPAGDRLNDKLTACAAALAGCQLDRLPAHLARRDFLARRYSEALAGLASDGTCRLPVEIPGRVWYRYAVQMSCQAESVLAALRARGVVAARPVESWCPPAGPACTAAFERTISLPLYPALTEAEQDRVINAFLTAAAPVPHP